ncbi:hypothetical protein DOY81_009312 [Sarcophaga bullata]|nr:hypothetical protein DOY81_009312 [Sarcophaga bullata]
MFTIRYVKPGLLSGSSDMSLVRPSSIGVGGAIAGITFSEDASKFLLAIQYAEDVENAAYIRRMD